MFEQSITTMTGTTTFKLKPFGAYEKEKKYELDQEPERKRALTRGQKKGLLKEVENMEDTDCALWSILTRRPAYLPKKWSFVLELFCGCALLTRMCQAQGYTTCEPMDVNTGWNVFNAAYRKYAESTWCQGARDADQGVSLEFSHPYRRAGSSAHKFRQLSS